MPTENFHASVQYNDLKGSSAADRHGERDFEKFLREKSLIQEEEMLVGITMASLEVHAQPQNQPVYVHAFVAKVSGYDALAKKLEGGAPLDVRNIRLNMTLNEFFGFFKRFEISISSGGLLERKDIHYLD